jgi:hypothetical protein
MKITRSGIHWANRLWSKTPMKLATPIFRPRHPRTRGVLPGLLALVLLAARSPAGAQTITPLANDRAVFEFAPAAAGDGTRWLVLQFADQHLLARTLDRTGTPVDPPRDLGRSVPLPPTAATAVGGGRFLVAWSAPDGAIYATAGDGNAPPVVLVPGTEATPWFVRGLAGDASGFLLVYQGPDDWSGPLYAQWVDPEGRRRGEPVRLIQPAVQNKSDGIEMPTVVAGGGRFLVAWQRHDSRLPGAAQNVTEAVLVRYSSEGALPGPVLTLSALASASHNPLAADFDGARFLVVWNHSDPGPSSHETLRLHGRWVSPDGGVEGVQTVFVNDPASHFPALAWDGRSHLLLWHQQDSGEVRWQYFRRDGSPRLPAQVLAELPRPEGPATVFPGVRFDGERFLAVLNVLGLVFDETGDIAGFSSGDVYTAWLPASPPEPAPPRLTQLRWSPDTGAHLRGMGAPGVIYRLEAAADPAGPWTSLGSAPPAGEEGAFEFHDPDTTRPRRFYRAVTP